MKRIMNPKTEGLFIAFMVLFLGISQSFSADKKKGDLADKVDRAIAMYYPDEAISVKNEANNKVVLEGTVHLLYDKLQIWEIAAKVPGVKYIGNEIYVDTPSIPNDVIKADLINQIDNSKSVLEPDRIKIEVDNGLVMLTGDVSFYKEKMIAEMYASVHAGVKAINNELTVLPRNEAESDANLKIVLDEILKYQFPLEKDVTFTIKDGAVNLNGTTTSLWAQRAIAHEFSRVLGIKNVFDHLKVSDTLTS